MELFSGCLFFVCLKITPLHCRRGGVGGGGGGGGIGRDRWSSGEEIDLSRWTSDLPWVDFSLNFLSLFCLSKKLRD